MKIWLIEPTRMEPMSDFARERVGGESDQVLVPTTDFKVLDLEDVPEGGIDISKFERLELTRD